MSAAPAETMAVRLESLEADVDSLRTESEALRPGIGRLISIEADIRDLLVQLALMKRQQTPTGHSNQDGQTVHARRRKVAPGPNSARPPSQVRPSRRRNRSAFTSPPTARWITRCAAGKKLSAAHRDVLDGLEYRISVIDLGSGRGTYYRLKAGPFDDIKAARQVCKAMKARKTFCVITDFSGDL